jgi:hypothetical protein
MDLAENFSASPARPEGARCWELEARRWRLGKNQAVGQYTVLRSDSNETYRTHETHVLVGVAARATPSPSS